VQEIVDWLANAFWRHIYPRLLPSSVNVLALQQLQQQRDALERPRNKEDIAQRVEERAGPEARRLFEGFIAQVERLQQQHLSAGGPLLLKKGSL
jgi:hypothetical protein